MGHSPRISIGKYLTTTSALFLVKYLSIRGVKAAEADKRFTNTLVPPLRIPDGVGTDRYTSQDVR
jgi:hypothetical protein